MIFIPIYFIQKKVPWVVKLRLEIAKKCRFVQLLYINIHTKSNKRNCDISSETTTLKNNLYNTVPIRLLGNIALSYNYLLNGLNSAIWTKAYKNGIRVKTSLDLSKPNSNSIGWSSFISLEIGKCLWRFCHQAGYICIPKVLVLKIILVVCA